MYAGIPPKLRERVWKLLASYYHSRHPGEVPMGNYPSSVDKVEYEAYKSLKTEYENVIVGDIGESIVYVVTTPISLHIMIHVHYI